VIFPNLILFIPLGSKHFLSTLFSDSFNLCSSLNVRDQGSCSYKLQILFFLQKNIGTRIAKLSLFFKFFSSYTNTFFPLSWKGPDASSIKCFTLTVFEMSVPLGAVGVVRRFVNDFSLHCCKCCLHQICCMWTSIVMQNDDLLQFPRSFLLNWLVHITVILCIN
jgi:hypothetical protein